MGLRKAWIGLVLLLLPVAGCDEGEAADDADNPFLQDMRNLGKEDSQYQNPSGVEVEVDLEADVEAPEYRIFDAPADLGQFVLTYLRKRNEFYLESLAEDSNSSGRPEWLVDGEWISTEQAHTVSVDKLTHFRITGMNAVLLYEASTGVAEGAVFRAKVPRQPYSVMSDAGNACAEPDSHISLDQSVYWYLWDPDRSGCTVATQEATLTVTRLFRGDNPTYPEYDQLAADSRITAVILFGQIGDDPLTDSDPGMRGFEQMASWLKRAGFGEDASPPVGRRFTKGVGPISVQIDLYSPRDFAGLSDYSHFSNFQRALSEHEIVAYDGHSMLGASDFWGRPEYPDFYQVFLYGGCLGYEYYLRPILAGKGGWEKVDIVSSVVEVSAGANDFAAPFLSKMMWAVENDYAASWKDMLIAIRNRVGDSTFGASGVRDNCYTPTGSLCTTPPDPGTSRRYDAPTAVPIPDNLPAGVTSVIEVPDALTARAVTVDLQLAHTWVGDLKIVLEHGGTEAVLWDRAGGSTHDIRQTFAPAAFAGAAAAGTWTLHLYDLAERDTGTLERWSLIVEP
jgi:hypothetical protein